jgi:AcrR family transcriptional regulator
VDFVTTGAMGAQPSKKASGRPALSTAERIVLASIELFNREGVQHVAVKDIAAALKISPGNLTYHFKLKQDLLRAAFAVLQKKMRTVLTPSLPAQSALQGGEYLVNILRAFWEFRFFFNALTYLLSKDPVLRREYFAFQEWALSTLARGLREMMDKRHFRPIRFPNTTRLLAENMWSQWLGWLRMQQLASPTAAMPEGQALYDSALHHWSLLEPYFPEDFANELLPVYRGLLLESATPSDSNTRPKRGVTAARPRRQSLIS